MMFFKKRRELIQEVKWYRNLYADALKEIEDLKEQSFRFQKQVVEIGKIYEDKLAEIKKKRPAKSTKSTTTKKVVKKTTTKTTKKGAKK